MTPLAYCLKLLSRRRYTEQQIREKLQQKLPHQDHDEAISRLKELGYLNDQEFAEAWIQYRSAISPRGKFALNRELRKKGVSKENSEQALSGIDESSAIKKLAEEKWLKIKGTSIFQRKQRLMRFLQQRGFSIANIMTAVNSITNSLDQRNQA